MDTGGLSTFPVPRRTFFVLPGCRWKIIFPTLIERDSSVSPTGTVYKGSVLVCVYGSNHDHDSN